jgi:hypothetical protein
VGLATPAAAIQTFFSAFASRDEAVLAQASALQPNGEPFVLTGMSTDWADRVMGAQILSSNLIDPKNPDLTDVRILTETRNASDTGEVLTHNVVTFRLHKENGEWRFAGKVRWLKVLTSTSNQRPPCTPVAIHACRSSSS